MNEAKEYELSLSGDTFNGFKVDFDQMLKRLLTAMEKYESEEATITVKMGVKLEVSNVRDYRDGAMKDVVKPTFKHDISTAMQIKDKKTGTLGGNYTMEWNDEKGCYVLVEIDNGQTSLFDQKPNEEESDNENVDDTSAALPPHTSVLPPHEGIIDADYTEVSDDKIESTPDTSDPNSAYFHLKKYVGMMLDVVEHDGEITVRSVSNDSVILSTDFAVTDRFYCSKNKLVSHIGHKLLCEQLTDSVAIVCDDCAETIFVIDYIYPNNTDEIANNVDDGYDYE